MPVTRICNQCHKKYTTKPSAKLLYCSILCSNKAKAKSGSENSYWKGGETDLICQECGNPFNAPLSGIKRGQHKFCSRACYGKHASGIGNSQYKEKIKVTCETCGKPFEVHPCHANTSKYCSKKCQNKSRETPRKECPVCGKKVKIGCIYCSKICRDKKRIPAVRVEKPCEYCGNRFQARPIEIKNGFGRFCTRRCFYMWRGSHMSEKQYTHAKGGKRDDLDNRYFRSSWEANWARYLNWLKETGNIDKWEYEVDTFEFPVKKGSKFYTPDFKVFNNDGTFEYHEIKGYMDPESKTKLKRMAKYYPDLQVILIDSDGYKAVARQMKNALSGWETVK